MSVCATGKERKGMIGEKAKVENFNISQFVADNAWLSTFEAIEKAYTAGVSEQEAVLDKIRGEIEQLKLHKAQFLTSDNKVCIDSQEVLNIIDKYKKSEG